VTRVCLVGDSEVNLQYELLSRETSREALATYDLERPFENTLAVRTVSIGAAVSLLNDLDWYLTRFVDEALVQEPSVSDTEWLSRPLARELRNGTLEPGETGEFCKIYGIEPAGGFDAEADATDEPGDSGSDGPDDPETGEPDDSDDPGADEPIGPTRLVEPLYVRRTDGELPTYDLRDVPETLVVRLTEAEYSP
jgi:hypothetical protein